MYDIQAGAIGLSLMTVTGLVAFLLAELLQRRRSKVQDTEVVGAAVVAADADAAVLAK